MLKQGLAMQTSLPPKIESKLMQKLRVLLVRLLRAAGLLQLLSLLCLHGKQAALNHLLLGMIGFMVLQAGSELQMMRLKGPVQLQVVSSLAKIQQVVSLMNRKLQLQHIWT